MNTTPGPADGEPVRISIGTEPSQWLATLVLMSSIRRRTSAPVEFGLSSWTPGGGWASLLRSKTKLRQGTRFSAWRWLVPEAFGFHGRAIYLDADQVVLGDIAELWGLLEPGKAVAMVRDAVGVFGKKRPEPGKWQTSVMVLDCNACRWDAEANFRAVADGWMAYRDLMQGTFLDAGTLQEIDPAWNHFGIRRDDTKLVHFSHVASQPWKRPRHLECGTWRAELAAAVAAGDVSAEDIREAVVAGFVHEEFLTVGA